MARKSKYPVELKERAVAMVRELEQELGPGRGAIARVAKHLGLHPETVRQWVRDEERGKRPSGERVAGSEADKECVLNSGPWSGRSGWWAGGAVQVMEVGPLLSLCRER